MNTKTNDMVKASLFLALGLIVPYIFHATGIPGTVFLPMHIPVLLCGFILGSRYGLIIGFITPFLNSLLLGMPPMYPAAVSMAFELATYGLVAGYFYKKRKYNIYVSLIISMLLGRVVSGIANYILYTARGKSYAFEIFLTSAFVKPVWGIIIQIVLIPIIVKALEKSNRKA